MFKRAVLLCGILLSLLTTGHVSAQTSIGSPYSRYGIGDLYLSNNTQNLGMGGSGLAWSNPGLINYLNPASYAAFDTMSFVFEGGMAAKFTQSSTTNLSQRDVIAGLTDILIGFPVTRRWKASLGLLPYSRMGYNVNQTLVDDTVGKITNEYKGTGGINQFYVGSAFNIARGLSLGFNAAYLFGDLSKTRAVSFPDSAFIYSYRVNHDTKIADVLFTLGLQYKYDLSPTNKIGTGITFSNAANINAYESMLSQTYVTGSTGTVIIKDTIEQYPETKGSLKFPYALGFGLIFEHSDQLMILADYKFQDWSNFTYLGVKDSLKNSYQACLGFQLTPDSKSGSSYFKKISYRAGFRYTQTYLQLRGNRLTEMGVSLGLALPVPRSRSHVNLAMELGRRGTTDSGLLKENYLKLSISATVFERWFVRRKFE